MESIPLDKPIEITPLIKASGKQSIVDNARRSMKIGVYPSRE